MKVYFFAIVAFLHCAPAYGVEDQWVLKVEEDPFMRGQRVTVRYDSSDGQAVEMRCAQSKGGFYVKVKTDLAYEPKMARRFPLMEYAIDGRMIWSEQAVLKRSPDGLAEVVIALTPFTGKWIVQALTNASEQVAILDGISPSAHLLGAAGAKPAGEALSYCMRGEEVPGL